MITKSKTKIIILTSVQLNVVYSPAVGLAIVTTQTNQQEVPWAIFVLHTSASTLHPTILIEFVWNQVFWTSFIDCRYLGKFLMEQFEHFFTPRTTSVSLKSQLNGKNKGLQGDTFKQVDMPSRKSHSDLAYGKYGEKSRRLHLESQMSSTHTDITDKD